MYNRPRISLDGFWKFSIPNGIVETRVVPGSYPCVGDSVYFRSVSIAAPQNGRRMRLCFEGIAYEGDLFFNGTKLGTMLPYSFYSYDITDLIRNGEGNEVRLELQDLNAVFGPSEGWKSFSGIIRSVFLEESSPVSLADVFFTYDFSDSYASAACNVAVALDGCANGLHLQAKLYREGILCADSGCVSAEIKDLKLDVVKPALWSPEHPYLYELEVTLWDSGTVIDSYTAQVGFKDFAISGNRFLLNGEDLFITGICRHDIWDDVVGFTMTDDMIETDLQMMKSMGVNYVRLVHYPHDRRVVDACDRIGLLCSEEPGLWWSDLSNKEITTRALKVLENVIYRDRNHVSIAFWLSFNECIFNEDFLRDSVATARRCDPSRLISGANCNDIYETKRLYDKYDVDFYTMHPYGTAPDHVAGGSLRECCTVLTGKPLIFTEWGGFFVHENPHLFQEFCDTMLGFYKNQEPEPVLAGMSYWQWQDIPEAQRGMPACYEGILIEGLVSMTREPKTNFYTYMHFLEQLKRPVVQRVPVFTPVGGGSSDQEYTPIALPRPEKDVWDEAVSASLPMPGYHHKKNRRITVGPALPKPVPQLGALITDLPAGRPAVVSTGSGALDVPVNAAASALWFIGQATMGKGYPVNGIRGTQYGEYVIRYTDGTQQIIPLRDGEESATVFGLIGPTAFDPRAAKTSRAFTIDYDRNWEVYHTGLLRVSCENKVIDSIRITVSDPEYYLLVYGITAEN